MAKGQMKKGRKTGQSQQSPMKKVNRGGMMGGMMGR